HAMRRGNHAMRRGKARGAAAIGLVAFCGCAANELPRNVVLLVVDTVRADHLGLYGHERPTSPRLDEWSTRGVVFEQALATSPWTVPSFASIYTGHLPSRHGAARSAQDPGAPGVSIGRLDDGVRTLAELLFERGFATAAIVNNPFLHARGGLARGFSNYDHEPGNNWNMRRADAVVDRTLRWIDQPRDTPFLIVAHLFDPHLDYDPPEPFRGRFAGDYDGGLRYPVSDLRRIRASRVAHRPEDRRFIAGAYDEELLYIDAQIGRLLDGLEERGLLDDTLIILVSDHGEEFFDHGSFEHGHSVYQELLRVPLVIWAPRARARRVAAPVSIADVLPTILAATGAEPEPGLYGRSLWKTVLGGDPPTERVFVAENTLRGGEQKALVRWPHKLVLDVTTGATQLFDLVDDPGETRDLSAENPAVRDQLLVKLHATVEAPAHGRPAQPTEFPPDTLERLRELGYLNGGGD
ncbi:MAG TPA: sulfatase, partial [Myxococcota bacterium]|nr:sulfatase [Myxococcota bacterium]